MSMLTSTLGRYFARQFVSAIAAVFFTVFLLIFMLDLVELMRRAGETEGATAFKLARLAFFRTPATAEQVLPFAILFAALSTFLNLSRKLELVVARAAGVSVWQFSLPIVAVAILIGTFATTVYNPVATSLKDTATRQEREIFTRVIEGAQRGYWLNQRSANGDTILHFLKIDETTFDIFDVTAYQRASDGAFQQRIEAPVAHFRGDHWLFESVRIVARSQQPERQDSYKLPTYLTKEQIRGSVGQSQAVSFWSLPGIVRMLELAGLDTTRYRLRYQSLLARPALLTAMVLIAASVSLRFLRSGGFAGMVLSGVTAGFVLYVATRIVEDLGNAGLVSTVFAAWAAPVIGGMLGGLALLHREDG